MKEVYIWLPAVARNFQNNKKGVGIIRVKQSIIPKLVIQSKEKNIERAHRERER